MGFQPHSLRAAGLKPPAETIEVFSRQFPNTPFSQLWSMFRDIANVGDDYFLCNFRDQEAIAEAIGHLRLSVKDMYQFIYAPVNCRDEIVKQCLVECATAVARNMECRVTKVIRLPLNTPVTRRQLMTFEHWHRAITMYLWLTFHFPETFTQYEEALMLKSQCEEIIKTGLSAYNSKERASRSLGLPDAKSSSDSESAEVDSTLENKYAMGLEHKARALEKLRKSAGI
ncbi:RNA helicase [Coemansia aciculifera]|nr:RNA helicase [Coemansia aciculifera]